MGGDTGIRSDPVIRRKDTMSEQRDQMSIIGILVGLFSVIVAVVAIGFSIRAVDRAESASGGGGGGAASAPVPVTLSEFAITPSDISVPVGGSLALSNTGSMIHNVQVGGLKSEDIPAGGTATLDLSSLEPGTYEIICAVVGHADSGMKGTLTISESATGGGDGGDHSDHQGGTNEAGEYDLAYYKQMDEKMLASFQPFIDALGGEPNTKGKGGQELAPTIAADGAKEWTLTAEIVDWEVEPGKIVKAWTYNGMVPGPTLRGEVGDHIRVKLINKLPMGTDIHMHGMILPNSMDGVAPITQPLVWPGEEFVYEYTVTEPAVAMYHPHHHGQMTVPNGMWGSMIFSPKGGGGRSDWLIPRGRTIGGIQVPADVQVAKETNMVLNDAGVIGLSLNGKSFPATEAYALKQGDWMLVNYYNEGLTYHPMHLHQFPQLVVARDGIPLDNPYWADTVTVGPGERYTVLFHAKQAGAWVWHCHILNHAEREDGMFGMVTAIAVE
jgi:plastocyanin